MEIPSKGAGTASMTNQPSQRALTFRYSGPGDSQFKSLIRLKGQENSRYRDPTGILLFKATIVHVSKREHTR